jgi:hypothetical protein
MSTENSKRERTITVNENCKLVKDLKNKEANGGSMQILSEARKAKMALKNQINDLEDSLDLLYDKVETAKVTLPINANTILDAEDEIALSERRLTKAKELYKELFGEDIKA